MKRLSQWRIYFLLIIAFLSGGVIILRLFSLQILKYDFYNGLSQNQHQLYQKLFPQRGEIFIQDLKSQRYLPLAVNKEFQQVYAIPNLIKGNKNDLAKQLSLILDLNEEIILNRINKTDDPYEPLKHKVDEETAEKIKALNIEGIKLAPEKWRYYPADSLASHLIGFVGIKDEKRIGQYGLEGYYENELEGQSGFLAGAKDMIGYFIPVFNQNFQSTKDGSRMILTIDQNIQFKAEKELEQIVEKWRADIGTIIIMEPKSGAVRALANWPNFNPNEYAKIEDNSVFLNQSVQSAFEPGSVFKPITMAAALDAGAVLPKDTYNDEGLLKIGGYTIRNADGKKYGRQTMTEILEKSLNTGAVFLQKKIGGEIFLKYVQDFGFGQPTNIDLAGEVKGNISNLSTNIEINFATASFGQGLTVTPIQLIAALGAIANQGKLMRPFVVDRFIQPDGAEKITQPQAIQEVISPETARQLTRMLVSAVENGYARPAGVKGYSIAGKTGTAQIADLEKGGYSDKTIHTFISYAPAFEPKFIILIKLNNPKDIRFAADSITPVSRRLSEYLFNYFEIAPES